MNHKTIHTDNGIDCYRCGMSVDFPWLPANEPDIDWDRCEQEQMEEEIRFFLPNCAGVSENFGHHFYAIGAKNDDPEHLISAIECQYGDAHIGWETDLAYVPRYCKGE
jgi:hypothetical protein